MTFLIVTLHCYADISSIGLPLPFAVLLAALGVPLGLIIVVSALRNAPEGYEDEKGFHFKQGRPVISHSPGVAILRPRNAG